MLSSAPVTAAVRRSPPVLYPETDHMGEGELQWFMAKLLQEQLAAWLAARRVVAHAGGNTFLYYREGDPHARIAPDVYVLPGVPQEQLGKTWRMWELSAPPSLAVEIVSNDAHKDYFDAPAIHSEIGTRELVVYDPEMPARSKTRVRFQVFRRLPKRGFVLTESTQEDRVRSVLGCFLRVVGRGDARRLRVAKGPHGDELLPTDTERLASLAKKASAEARRAAELEAEVVATQARVAELEAELARRR